MSAQDFSSWVPVEFDPNVTQRPSLLSAIESHATGVPMNYETKTHPRSGAATAVIMGKSSAFGEDSGVNDNVTLVASKIGKAFRIANEDLDDSLPNVIKYKQAEFAIAYSKLFDNACLGTTAASNGAGGTIPFTSLYRSLIVADTNTSYTASANYGVSATSGGVTYSDLSNLLGLAEASDWYDPNSQLIIAHPSVKKTLRNIKDSQNRPIFVQGLAGTPDSLFDLPIKWTLGARTSATASGAPAGNPLIFSVNPNYLLRGDRSGVEAKVDLSVGALTDEAILIMRARKAFVVTAPGAHAVLEVLS